MRSDEALYEALLKGDMSAFDALYERYERPLFGFIRRQLQDSHEAEDVLHETVLAVLRDRKGAKAARSFRAWLFQVARHLCLNRERSRKRATRALLTEAQSPAEPARSPELQLTQHQTAEALRSAVAKLPAKLAELYELRAGGMSYEEMADVLEVPVGTIKSRMHQLVEQLRQEMK